MPVAFHKGIFRGKLRLPSRSSGPAKGRSNPSSPTMKNFRHRKPSNRMVFYTSASVDHFLFQGSEVLNSILLVLALLYDFPVVAEHFYNSIKLRLTGLVIYRVSVFQVSFYRTIQFHKRMQDLGDMIILILDNMYATQY